MLSAGNIKAQENNNFYDDAETFELSGPGIIKVEGEVSNPGMIELKTLPKHTVIVKEAVLDGDKNKFVGAYRYDGYSLFDILNDLIPEKKNKDEFNPIIDLYVEIFNDKGESVIFSWGEIYYPIHLHEVLIASSVMRIVPSKTKELWPLPQETRLVSAHDLLTERNISSPNRIVVHSASRHFKVDRELTPLFSPEIKFFKGNDKVRDLSGSMKDLPQNHYESVFYGRGRGIHSTTPFDGVLLEDVLSPDLEINNENIRNGYFIIAAADGYRSVYTFSEVFNRNDQAEFLLIYDPGNTDGGSYRIFPAADFFSDRAIKAVSEIYFELAP